MLVEITIKVPGAYITKIALPHNDKVKFYISPVFGHKRDIKDINGW